MTVLGARSTLKLQRCNSDRQEISKIPLLSAAEEHELAAKAIAGDAEARDRLVEANLRLVFSIASKYCGKGVEVSDLVQEGSIGLMRAIEKFDPQRGTRLSSYAIPKIKQAVQTALGQARAMNIPYSRIADARRLERVRSDFMEQKGRAPSDEELCQLLHWSARRLRGARTIPTMLSLEELDRQGEKSEDGAESMISGESADFEQSPAELQAKARRLVARVLSQLQANELCVLSYRSFKPPLTFEECGQIIGISKERCRQLHERAVGKLRAQFAGKGQGRAVILKTLEQLRLIAADIL